MARTTAPLARCPALALGSDRVSLKRTIDLVGVAAHPDELSTDAGPFDVIHRSNFPGVLLDGLAAHLELGELLNALSGAAKRACKSSEYAGATLFGSNGRHVRRE